MSPRAGCCGAGSVFAEAFPQVAVDGKIYHFTEVAPGKARLRLDASDRHLRPGGTVSGPTLFTLADYAAYGVILAHLGPVALVVTTGAHIDFLRKPVLGAVMAQARLLKLGKRLAVVCIAVEDSLGELVAQATMTYSIPPQSVPAAGA
ncbi:MAG: PaaI family thioesterase [Phyllobacteriaceae bacterium]|nr:PaaI family thioesterase [Phyllobacteriaceae bacterium]